MSAIGEGPTLETELGLGERAITLRVTDSFETSDTGGMIVAVRDTTAPTLSVASSPGSLWPVSHMLVPMSAAAASVDACSEPQVQLVSVTSSEPDDGLGDGSTEDGVQGADVGAANFEFSLRPERSGPGYGRRYAVVYEATDPSGNLHSATRLNALSASV